MHACLHSACSEILGLRQSLPMSINIIKVNHPQTCLQANPDLDNPSLTPSSKVNLRFLNLAVQTSRHRP